MESLDLMDWFPICYTPLTIWVQPYISVYTLRLPPSYVDFITFMAQSSSSMRPMMALFSTNRYRHLCMTSICFEITEAGNRSVSTLIAYVVLILYVFPCPLFQHALNLIQTLISNYIHYKVWDEITFPFPNLKCHVWEWKCNSMPTLYNGCDYSFMVD